MFVTLLELGEVVDDDDNFGERVAGVLGVEVRQRVVIGQPLLAVAAEVAQHAHHLIDARRFGCVDHRAHMRYGLDGLEAAAPKIERVHVEIIRRTRSGERNEQSLDEGGLAAPR